MKILFNTLLLFFTFKANAQNFEKIFNVNSTVNTNEYANTGISLPNGNYLVGINNTVLCLAPNGDSLWTKTYVNYGYVDKLFFNNSNELFVATTRGKMVILKINPNNGDSIGAIAMPTQPSNSGYTIYDMHFLPDGDIVYSYNNGGGFGGIIRRFTPGQTTNKWSNDYAGENWAPKNILIDDTTIIMAGYKGTSGYTKLVVRKIGISNTPIWNKELERGTYNVDRKLGIQKNSTNEYLVATSFNVTNILAPTVVKFSNSGDSLSSSAVTSFNGITINYGYLTSLMPTNGGFYAAGCLNYNKMSPDNVMDGMGHMAVFKVNDNGQIGQANAYNLTGFYQYNVGSNYDGAEGWGNACFDAGSGKYLLLGVCQKIYDPGTGANFQALWKGYVVKSDSLLNVMASNLIEISNANYQLFPNPFYDKFYCNYSHGNDPLEIYIYDSKGVLVLYQSNIMANTAIDLRHINKGVYFVNIIDKNNFSTIKLIKD